MPRFLLKGAVKEDIGIGIDVDGDMDIDSDVAASINCESSSWVPL